MVFNIKIEKYIESLENKVLEFEFFKQKYIHNYVKRKENSILNKFFYKKIYSEIYEEFILKYIKNRTNFKKLYDYDVLYKREYITKIQLLKNLLENKQIEVQINDKEFKFIDSFSNNSFWVKTFKEELNEF